MNASDDTLLVLTGIGIPAYSARGLSQTLEPIGAAAFLARTVNGALRNLSSSQFEKYQSTVSCTDMAAPALEGVWPGKTVIVECITELCYPIGGSPSRSFVSGSEYSDGDFVFYRPVLEMMVTSYTSQKDEWGATVQWQLQLEEI